MKSNQTVSVQEQNNTRIYAGRKSLRRSAAILLAVLLLCCVGVSPAFAEQPQALTYNTLQDKTPMSPAEVYAATVNSTVGITTSVKTNIYGYETLAAASGSGFLVTSDGYILTNYHVVENSKSITVTLFDGSSYEAELIGYDASNDIAVLKIDAEGLTPVTFGDSDELAVGQEVLAIGNPLGELTFSLTRGIISALNRDITLSGGLRMRLIQTDCAINSGNSGGALFNLYGEVVGITNAKYSGSGSQTSVDNIGFAIPVNAVADIVEQIMTKGQISTPYIGVTVNNVSSDLTAYGIPAGAHVGEVVEGSPAAEAGILPRDIITAVNGTPISGSGELADLIHASAVGDELVLSIYRQGETLELSVTVGEKVKDALPEEAETAAPPEPQGTDGLPQDQESLEEFFEHFFTP